MNFLSILILSIVEGFTEFLPVSSTAHILMVSRLLHVVETDFVKTFSIVIQLGAILAVVVLYFKRLLIDWETNKKVIVAFIPTAIVGFLLYKIIKGFFFENILLTSVVLGLGGLFLIVFEYFYSQRKRLSLVTNIRDISYTQAFTIGLAQALSVVPGVSRAAATIVGGMALGIERKTIVEFSFLLAIPTMAAATLYDLYKNASILTTANIQALSWGFVISFIAAFLGVRFLIDYVKRNSFTSFGVYRVLVALLFIAFLFVR